MNRGCPLQIQRGVIFGKHVLAIGFFAHLDVGDRIASFLQIGNLRRCIVGSVVQHRDRHHGGKSARYTAGEEEIESHSAPAWSIPGPTADATDRPTNNKLPSAPDPACGGERRETCRLQWWCRGKVRESHNRHNSADRRAHRRRRCSMTPSSISAKIAPAWECCSSESFPSRLFHR